MIKLAAPPGCGFLWDQARSQWALTRTPGGEAAAVRATPFVIGRSPDAQLVLPQSPEFQATTSRWHCHLLDHAGTIVVVDGSLAPMPETGKPKPSLTGTLVNGRRITGPTALKEGDELGIGPWRFRVEASVAAAAVDIDQGLTQLGAAQPRALKAEDPRLRQGFARLHRLSQELNKSSALEQNLVSIAECALAELPAAQVVSILQETPEGLRSRLAWQRGVGRVFNLRFSSGLVWRLPQDRSHMLAVGLRDPTISQLQQKISSALLVPLWGADERLGILYLDNRGGMSAFSEDDMFLAGALASHASLQLLIERQAFLSRVENNMSHYFGQDVVKLIVEEARKGRPVLPGVKEQEATIVFIDLQGFSAFCRDRPPREVAELLNPYFQLCAECIHRHSGYVDKFIGDGVLGVFGAQPIASADTGRDNHAAQAVRACIEIGGAWAAKNTMPLRIGMNSGAVVIGNVGFPGRMEYSVLGDAVNLASRMEKLAPPNGIALTGASWDMLAGEFPCVDSGEHEVKGFGKVRAFRIET